MEANILNPVARKRMKKLLTQVEKEKKIIAASRDRLRDLSREIDEIADNIDEAIDDFTRGTDALSRYV
ncbi:MAG: hypothetical protein EOP83_04695 [Verrucomicrobiaceae bacterium]|nr:MAG: hypothetical protein EOP83_04695 [Verrucomicrobiaceae bacterium]